MATTGSSGSNLFSTVSGWYSAYKDVENAKSKADRQKMETEREKALAKLTPLKEQFGKFASSVGQTYSAISSLFSRKQSERQESDKGFAEKATQSVLAIPRSVGSVVNLAVQGAKEKVASSKTKAVSLFSSFKLTASDVGPKVDVAPYKAPSTLSRVDSAVVKKVIAAAKNAALEKLGPLYAKAIEDYLQRVINNFVTPPPISSNIQMLFFNLQHAKNLDEAREALATVCNTIIDKAFPKGAKDLQLPAFMPFKDSISGKIFAAMKTELKKKETQDALIEGIIHAKEKAQDAIAKSLFDGKKEKKTEVGKSKAGKNESGWFANFLAKIIVSCAFSIYGMSDSWKMAAKRLSDLKKQVNN